MALIERETSGQGQWVHSSLLAAQIQLLDFQASKYLFTGEVPQSTGNDHPTIMPQGLYPTATDPINIASSGEGMWEKCCLVLAAPELWKDPRFANGRSTRRQPRALNEAIAAKTRQRPAEVLDRGVQRRRHSVRTGVDDRQGVCRSASPASRHGRTRHASDPRRHPSDGTSGKDGAHAIEHPQCHARARPAHRDVLARTRLRHCANQRPSGTPA